MVFYLFDNGPALVGLLVQDDRLQSETCNEAGHRFARTFIMAVNDEDTVGGFRANVCRAGQITTSGANLFQTLFQRPDNFPQKAQRPLLRPGEPFENFVRGGVSAYVHGPVELRSRFKSAVFHGVMPKGPIESLIAASSGSVVAEGLRGSTLSGDNASTSSMRFRRRGIACCICSMVNAACFGDSEGIDFLAMLNLTCWERRDTA
jgi:hypothetical protein